VAVDLDAAKTAFLTGRLDEAEALFRAGLSERPASAASDLGSLYVHTGRMREGVGLLLKAIERSPGWALPRYNLALALLGLGHSELGWMLFEARRALPELKAPSPDFPFPEWTGQPLAGRRLVVLGEQGAGDQIMFARYIPVLQQQGAEVIFVCDAALASLLPAAVAGIARRTAADYWAPLLSLPYRLGPALAAPPPPLLAVLSGGGGGIGVMAAGSPTHSNDLNRSLRGADARRLLALGRSLAPEATGAGSFLDTARIIAGLDLVISVDTAIAHLAASLGKPTWILIPELGVDWRWGRRSDRTAWYPSARLYRQAQPGDWRSVLDAVEGDLGRLGLS